MDLEQMSLNQLCDLARKQELALTDCNASLMEQTELADRCRKQAETMEAENLTLHRKLAGNTLYADQGWQLYEEANRDRKSLRADMEAAAPQQQAQILALYDRQREDGNTIAALREAAPQQHAQAAQPTKQYGLAAYAQANADSIVTGNAQAAQAVEVAGLGSITNEDDGVLTLRFKDEDLASDFMNSHMPTVDCRDMPPAAPEIQVPPGMYVSVEITSEGNSVSWGVDSESSYMDIPGDAPMQEKIAVAAKHAAKYVADNGSLIIQQPAAAPSAPALTVFYGAMPESNGAQNFTATLTRKGAVGLDRFDGFTFSRSEYPDRVRYDADCMRHLIGELDKEPDLLDYDETKHSGYAEPAAAPAIQQEAAALDDVPVRKQTDLSRRLRDTICAEPFSRQLTVTPRTLLAAADEIDRYYTGMLNWKATAEAKDLAVLAAPAALADAAPDGESWQHKCEETERALIFWRAKAAQGRAAGIEEAAEVVKSLINPQGNERWDADDPITYDGWESGQVDALSAIRAINKQEPTA